MTSSCVGELKMHPNTIRKEDRLRLHAQGLKWCPRCENVKTLDNFSRLARSWDGHYSYCFTCSRSKQRTWSRENKVWLRPAHRTSAQHWRLRRLAVDPGLRHVLTLRERHKMQQDEYDRMLAEQAGVCAICFTAPKQDGPVSGRVLHVDHDHKTGTVRGLLCSLCNKGLGHFRDDPKVIVAAAHYILTTAPAYVPEELDDSEEGGT